MRSHPTDAEHRLWQILRAKRLEGHKFRRQVPFEPYTVDFVCHAAKLIVEADGGQHGGERDLNRDEFLNSRGYRVLRFWNNDILQNEDGVLTRILGALEAPAAASSRADRPPLPNPVPADRRVRNAPGIPQIVLGARSTRRSAGTPARGEGL